MGDKAAMKVTMKTLDSMELDPFNARVHPQRNLDAIRESLLAFGQVEPLLVRKANNTVIGGNGRLLVMRDLGWKEASVVLLDIDEQKARALSLALNRSGELSTWDEGKLADTLRGLQETGFDMVATGFDDAALQELLKIGVPDMSEFAKPDLAPNLPSKPNGDGNWFYIEFYGKDAEFAQLKTILEEQMTGLHEIKPEFFVKLVERFYG